MRRIGCIILTMLEKEFGKEKMWVNWRFQNVKGKLTKVPYCTKTKNASSTDPKTWRTYEEVAEAADNGKNHFDGIGIVFIPDNTLLGIDFDDCLKDKEIVHEKKAEIEQFILLADTYTEVSPSGKGIHIFLKLSTPLKLTGNKESRTFIKTKRKALEIYTGDRYFTVTNDPYGKEKPVRTVSKEEALKLLAIIGYPWKKDGEVSTATTEHLTHLSDADVLYKMFSSKNGDKIKKLYDGDTSAHGDDDSASDEALCLHFAFWTAKEPAQMERLWLESPLGKREKTQKRLDYRKRTIDAAIAFCKDVYVSREDRVVKDAGGVKIDFLFVLNKDGDKVFIMNTENMCRILREHPHFQGRFRYDVFKNSMEILPTKTNIWRGLELNDAVNIQTAISILYHCFAKVGKDMVYDAIIKVAKENTIDSAMDFIKSLVWDKIPRLDSWLTKTYGAPDDAYHRAVAANWMKGLVKRIVEPGCKFDYVLVLEGEQGSKKSTSLYVLGRDWHVETTMSTDSKDFFMQFQGKAIVEFSEGETLSRTEVKRMKAIITMQFDKYRPPYERTSQDFPRRCVFAMTTNQTEYLKDETGNRRWLPVAVVFPEADIEWLENNRNQLFAEAYHRAVIDKEKIYEFPKEETLMQQNARRINDPNTELVVNWYFNELSEARRQEGITVQEVYRLIHGTFAKPIDKYQEMVIGDMLRRVLKLSKKRKMIKNIQANRWYNEAEPVVELSETDKMVKEIYEKW